MSLSTMRLVAVGAATGLAAAVLTAWAVGTQSDWMPVRPAAVPRVVRASTPPHAPRARLVSHVHHVEGPLPAIARRGPAGALPQYPVLSVASPAQRTRAAALLGRIRRGARAWSTPRAATAAGFGLTPVRRTSTIGYLHAENRVFAHDGRYLDPGRPEALIYANGRGRRTLVGAMFAMPRNTLGPTPGGPITRWHTHRVCVRGAQRGLTPRPDGTCPPGTRAIQGSEMLHVWFTSDLRSAFAIHAPEPELCRDRLLPAGYCA